jgi:hypothetical protein
VRHESVRQPHQGAEILPPEKSSFHARSAVELPLRSISEPSSFSGFDYTRLEAKRFEAKP